MQKTSNFTSKYMLLAIQEAKKALKNNEIPIGCALVNNKNPQQIFTAYNTIEKNKNPIQHAEINVIQQAIQQLKVKYLQDFDIYITLEPCHMCAYAIALTRIKNLYFGTYNTKTGALYNSYNLYNITSHKPNITGGIHEKQCSELLQIFFNNKRESKKD